MAIHIKRIYEPAARGDGARVLIDRLWPRGVGKAHARLTVWMKQLAPSAALRVWFGHRPERFAEFSRRYKAELRSNPDLEVLRSLARRRAVTLLYAARDPLCNHALVLRSLLRGRGSGAAARLASRRGS